MRVTMLHNPTSGDAGHTAEALTSLLERHGHTVTYASSKEEDWESVLDLPSELVVAAGGDGTVRNVFTYLAGRGVPVTLLPLGTANNIAAALGYDGDDLDRLVDGWRHATTRRFDVGRAEAPWGEARFVESLGGGVLASVLRQAGQERPPEDGDKVAQGLRLLAQLLLDRPARRWELELDGRARAGEYKAVEVLNVPETGPRLPLAPQADPGDGRFDVLLLDAEAADALAVYVEERRRGRDPERPPLATVAAERVTLRPLQHVTFRVDDETWPDDAAERGPVEATIAWTLDVVVPS